MTVNERIQQIAAEGDGSFESVIHGLSQDIEGVDFTVEQTNAALGGATVDALIILSGIVGTILQTLGMQGSPEDLAGRIAATFNMALASQLWEFANEDVVEADIEEEE